MYSAELAIRDFLKYKGVQTFWIDSAVAYIKLGLFSNTYISRHVMEQKVTVSPTGNVKRYTATISVTYPDTNRTGTIILTYTFDPKRKVAHSMKVR
jgi:hypothetical protein